MKGIFLALEGTDGAGKSSQLALLANFYKKAGRRIKALHFPRLNEKPYGEMVAAFLRGEYGPVDSVHPRLAALLYSLDRMDAGPELTKFIENGGVVLVDRYIHSNLAYQGAKTEDPAERDKLEDWIETLEYIHHNIPRPDLTLFLNAPLTFTLKTLDAKRDGTDRDYLQGKVDIHEASKPLQEKVRDEFLRMARSRPTEIAVIDCLDMEKKMADKATIHSRILDALRYHALL
ncbi:MAG: thymidylate kinase [Planctomycetes bacterium]|nr:thymidylate kinase [Planctomycetota bacterium]